MQKLFSPVPLWGSDGSDEGSSEGEGGEEGREESKEESRTLTSAELEAMTARAASRGSRKGVKSLRDELGFESVDEMKAFVEAKRKADLEAQSEEEKATKAAADAVKAAEAEKIAASALRRQLVVERQIVRAGVTDEKKTERIATLLHADLDSDLEPDEYADAVDTAIEGLKADMPELFATKKVAGSGDGGARGDSEGETDDDADREKALIAEYAARGLRIPASG